MNSIAKLLTPDLVAAQKMLEMLDCKNEQFTFQTFADHKDGAQNLVRTISGALDDHKNALEHLNRLGAGIFVTINETDLQGRKANNIKRIRALWVDFDTVDNSRVKRLKDLSPAPNLIIETSQGKHHAYWIVNEGEIPLNQFTALQKRLIHYFAYDGADKAIHDVSRVMRLAGFIHQKGTPFISQIVHSDAWHNADELIRWVESLPIAEKEIKKPLSTINKTKAVECTSLTISLPYEQSKLLARNRWPEIIAKLGYQLPANNTDHSSCPICGGDDRFRFDNQNGDGSFICSQGTGETIAGDGYKLLEHAGMSSSEALSTVNHILNNMGLISEFDSKPQKKTEWQQPMPLSQVNNAKPTPFPIDSLPLLARQASEAIAERVQAPIAMAAMCVLGTMSHIAQAQVNAPKVNDIYGNGEPCSLFLITEGGSGSRKSSCKEISDKAIHEYEKQQYEVFKLTHEQWKARLLEIPKKDRDAFMAENPEPQNPKTLFNDITFESLAGLYIDGTVLNVSINTDEAAQFFGGHSMKSETANNVLGGFTKLFDDGFVQRQRAKSNENGSGQAYDVRLTFNLQGQHEILSKELKDPIKREQGFLPRFLFAAPESLAGRRMQDEAFRLHSKGLMDDVRLTAYWGRCAELIAKADIPKVIQDGEKSAPSRNLLKLSREADQYDLVFYNECEQLQLDGKEYETIKPFASRAAQLARRIATVLAFFEQRHEVSKEIMSAACDIVRYSLKEWLRYADIEPKKESHAEKLLKWLVKQKDKSILYSKAQGYAPNPIRNNKQLLDQVLQELEDFNYIRMTELGRRKYIEMNPNL